jgi:BolA protein
MSFRMAPSAASTWIEARLREAFHPDHLEILDESRLHAGHAAAGGGGHFAVRIVSPAFEGLATLARHRLVHRALAPEMSRAIHALALGAYTPAEWASGASESRVSTVPRSVE